MRVFVTGGAGYIGSHTIVELVENGLEVFVYDNFSNSSPSTLTKLEKKLGTHICYREGDIRDEHDLVAALKDFSPDVVVHFAGLKVAGESSALPLPYYDTNVGGSIALLKAMDIAGCMHIVFSSSAAVYGNPEYLPCDEKHPLAPVSPYGRTKMFAEKIIGDWATADPKKSAVILRYFNPVGAHPSGMIGENPKKAPSNLMPLIAQVSAGILPELIVYGGDYDTRDGTGERDYVHVSDLARAHVESVMYSKAISTVDVLNIGTGSGQTVLELIEVFERMTGQRVPFRIAGRRPGDIAASIANCAKAEETLNWKARFGVAEMCHSVMSWQNRNSV